jgi:ribonuclease III
MTNLQKALTHPSFAHEHGCESYERLELLGDAILRAIATDLVLREYPEFREGYATALVASMVCNKTLATLARNLGINQRLRMGKGAKANKENEQPGPLADAFEAFVAAHYLDNGFEATRKQFQDLYLGYGLNSFMGIVRKEA